MRKGERPEGSVRREAEDLKYLQKQFEKRILQLETRNRKVKMQSERDLKFMQTQFLINLELKARLDKVESFNKKGKRNSRKLSQEERTFTDFVKSTNVDLNKSLGKIQVLLEGNGIVKGRSTLAKFLKKYRKKNSPRYSVAEPNIFCWTEVAVAT